MTPIILAVRTVNTVCNACGAKPGQPCCNPFGPVAWTHAVARNSDPAQRLVAG